LSIGITFSVLWQPIGTLQFVEKGICFAFCLRKFSPFYLWSVLSAYLVHITQLIEIITLE